LAFKVPISILNPVQNNISYVSVGLTVPYRHKLGGIIPERKLAQFAAAFVLLPSQAGSIIFDTDVLVQHTSTQPNQSREFIQDVADDDIPSPIGSGLVSIASVTPGWYLKPAEVQRHFNFAAGDYIDFGNRSNPTSAAWSFGCRHHGGIHVGAGSGQVHFYLTWTEYKDDFVPSPSHQEQPLNWGAAVKFDVPGGGTWSATYIDFKKNPIPITPQTNNPYLRVIQSGRTLIISAIP
jgi:hypothetical protein